MNVRDKLFKSISPLSTVQQSMRNCTRSENDNLIYVTVVHHSKLREHMTPFSNWGEFAMLDFGTLISLSLSTHLS